MISLFIVLAVGGVLFAQGTITPGQQGIFDLISRLKFIVVTALIGVIVIADGWAIIVAMFRNQSAEGSSIIKYAGITTVAAIVLLAVALSPILPNVVFFALGSTMPTAPG